MDDVGTDLIWAGLFNQGKVEDPKQRAVIGINKVNPFVLCPAVQHARCTARERRLGDGGRDDQIYSLEFSVDSVIWIEMQQSR
jgi:hypothetical protein